MFPQHGSLQIDRRTDNSNFAVAWLIINHKNNPYQRIYFLINIILIQQQKNRKFYIYENLHF